MIAMMIPEGSLVPSTIPTLAPIGKGTTAEVQRKRSLVTCAMVLLSMITKS